MLRGRVPQCGGGRPDVVVALVVWPEPNLDARLRGPPHWGVVYNSILSLPGAGCARGLRCRAAWALLSASQLPFNWGLCCVGVYSRCLAALLGGFGWEWWWGVAVVVEWFCCSCVFGCALPSVDRNGFFCLGAWWSFACCSSVLVVVCVCVFVCCVRLFSCPWARVTPGMACQNGDPGRSWCVWAMTCAVSFVSLQCNCHNILSYEA